MTDTRKVELVDFHGAIEIDKQGRVVMHFNRPMSGLVMDPEQALGLAKGLVETAQEALHSGAIIPVSRLPIGLKQ